MALQLFQPDKYFKKIPSVKNITRFGKRAWDSGIEYKSEMPDIENPKRIFTMPGFGRNGRWGNMVFQYLFIRILALNNNAEVELYREKDWINNLMCHYEDMSEIATVTTKSGTILMDSFHLFPQLSDYIPLYIWRAMFVSNVRRQKCLLLSDVDATINKPLTLENAEPVEVEGLFIVNPKLYRQQHKEFILDNLFKPGINFADFINDCIEKLGNDKTIIGIHIRRGDFVSKPLNQLFQIPISVKYIIEWLASNITLWESPVIYVCSDDPNAYKEIETAGFEVFHTKKIDPESNALFNYEQVEWELLRHCNILLTSNSTFSFSAALLNKKDAKCYQFSLSKKMFVCTDPWESQPLQFFASSQYIWSYLYSRFKLVCDMVSVKFGCKRLLKDMKLWVLGQIIRIPCLYYLYGYSSKFFFKLFNPLGFLKITYRNKNIVDYYHLKKTDDI